MLNLQPPPVVITSLSVDRSKEETALGLMMGILVNIKALRTQYADVLDQPVFKDAVSNLAEHEELRWLLESSK